MPRSGIAYIPPPAEHLRFTNILDELFGTYDSFDDIEAAEHVAK
ncbi:hypothetical protein ADILRU_2337 [Leifsonia rubra CMS 76R]|nr:hypothetical protein ADILRU_2337 [Leifsonia rubra CMS 76R]